MKKDYYKAANSNVDNIIVETNKEKRANGIIKYAITYGAMLLMSLTIVLSAELFKQTEIDEIMKILCDAFSVSGLLAICAGLLVMVANEGFFTSIKYLGKSVLGAFVPTARLKQKSYKEFKEKEDGKEKIKNFGFLFVCGLSFFIVGIVFLILFYVYSPM